MKPLRVGDRVRLTARFLRATGQFTGGDGLSEWTIVACDCVSCRSGYLVATDESSPTDETRARHIARGNLCRIGELDPTSGE